MTSGKDLSNDEKLSDESGTPASLDLKALREAKGIALQDIFRQTRVSAVNLEAIETGQFHLLPPPAYAKTFIKAYAEAVGTDVNILLGAYNRYLQSINVEEELEKDRRKATRKNRGRKRLFIGFVLLIVMVVGIMLAMSLHQQTGEETFRGETPQPAEQKAEAKMDNPIKAGLPTDAAQQTDQTGTDVKIQGGQVTPPPVSQKTSEALSTGASTTPPAAERKQVGPSESRQTEEPGKAYRLVIEARELTWIRIKADHHQSSQVILNPGQKIERFAAERFVVDVGNAAGIDLSFQGRSMGRLGKQGQVVHLTLP